MRHHFDFSLLHASHTILQNLQEGWMREIGVDETGFRDPDPQRCLRLWIPNACVCGLASNLQLFSSAFEQTCRHMPPTLPSLLCRSGVNTAGSVTGTIEEFDREDKPRTMVGQGQVCLYLSINLLLYSLLFWFKSFRQLTVLDGSFSLNVESHNVTCFGFQFCNA